MYLKTLYIVLLLLVSGYYFIAPLSMDKEVISSILILVFFSIIFFLFRKENHKALKGQFLRHSTLVIIGILIVHFQYYIDFLLGNIAESNYFIFVNTNIVVKSMTLSSIGLLSFFIGYLFYNNNNKVIKNTDKKIYNIRFLLFGSVVSLVAYFLTVNPLYLLGYYGSVDMGPNATYAILLFNLFIFAAIIQKCRNIINKKDKPTTFRGYVNSMGYPILFMISIYLMSVLISGDRGPLITYALCYISGYFFITKSKLSLKTGLLFIFAGAFVITLLGVARSQDKSLSFVDKIQAAFKDNPLDTDVSFLPQTKELATSVKAVHHAVDFVPAQHDFLYGRFQFQQLSSSIPFFNFFNSVIFSDNSKKYAGSASFITWIYQGDNPSYGNGTSIIADFYLDFGLIGVIIGMFIFGFTMRKAEVGMYSGQSTLFFHVFIIVYLSNAIYISRSSFLFGFRTVFWIFLVLLINQHLFNKKINA